MTKNGEGGEGGSDRKGCEGDNILGYDTLGWAHNYIGEMEKSILHFNR